MGLRRPPNVRLAVCEFEFGLEARFRLPDVLDRVDHHRREAGPAVHLFPLLSADGRVFVAHPVVVQPGGGLGAVVPGRSLVAALSAPAHGAALAATRAPRSGVEPPS